MIKIKDEITITINIQLAKEIMRLAVQELNVLHDQSQSWELNEIESAPLKEFYNALAVKLGGNDYDIIQKSLSDGIVFEGAKFNRLPKTKQYNLIFGDIYDNRKTNTIK